MAREKGWARVRLIKPIMGWFERGGKEIPRGGYSGARNFPAFLYSPGEKDEIAAKNSVSSADIPSTALNIHFQTVFDGKQRCMKFRPTSASGEAKTREKWEWKKCVFYATNTYRFDRMIEDRSWISFVISNLGHGLIAFTFGRNIPTERNLVLLPRNLESVKRKKISNVPRTSRLICRVFGKLLSEQIDRFSRDSFHRSSCVKSESSTIYLRSDIAVIHNHGR